MSAEAKHVAVIGAGISGLACAWWLQQMGVPFTIFEASQQAGGLIGTVEKDGFLFESGPQSFQGTATLLELVKQLGMESELCTANGRAPRYVLKNGKLQKIPMSPPAILATQLLSVGSRMRIASEPLTRTKPPGQEESVAAFVRRKFGHEILEYLVSPFVSGVYAGDPEQLSLKAAFPTLDEWEREYGSVLRGAMKARPAGNGGERKGPPPLCSFRQGNATLTRAMAEKLGGNLRSGTLIAAVASCHESGKQGFQVRASGASSGAGETIAANAVVMATPAYVAGQLLRGSLAAVAQQLSGIAYAGVVVVGAGYDAKQTAGPLDGFGVLIPRSEKHRTLGTVWNSALFPGRAPENHFAITSFVGGATDAEMLAKSDDEIAAIVEEDNAKILGISGPPVARAVWKHPKALPQYNLGHGHVVEAIRDAEQGTPGLFFAGNYLEGPSIGKCIEQGFKTAEAVKAQLETQR